MIVHVETPNGERGQVCGFAISPGTAELDEDYLVLVAIAGKRAADKGKLEVYDPKDLAVLFAESEGS